MWAVYTWGIIAVLFMAFIPASLKVFKDHIFDDDDYFTIFLMSAFWPLVTCILILVGAWYGVFSAAVWLLKFGKETYKEIRESKQ